MQRRMRNHSSGRFYPAQVSEANAQAEIEGRGAEIGLDAVSPHGAGRRQARNRNMQSVEHGADVVRIRPPDSAGMGRPPHHIEEKSEEEEPKEHKLMVLPKEILEKMQIHTK